MVVDVWWLFVRFNRNIVVGFVVAVQQQVVGLVVEHCMFAGR